MKFWLALFLLLASPVLAQDKEDPTRNVLDKVIDAVKRIDDLGARDRAMEELRYTNLKDSIALRADYEDKLRRAEAGRLDAIRLVDTTNLSVDRERAAATAQALQKKGDDSALVLSAAVVKSADDVRNTVKTTADEQARNLATQLAGIQSQFTDVGKRLSLLEQVGAEGLGRQKFQDPAVASLVSEVRALREAATANKASGEGSSYVVALIMSGLGLFAAMAGALIAIFRRSPNVQPVLPVEPVYTSGTKRR